VKDGLDKPRVLVVDDEEVITTVLSTILESWGFESHAVNNPSEVLRLLEKEEFDLILLDIRMPEISGLELLERIKGVHPSIPVIMITAVGTAEAAVKALKLGAEGFITKPFDQDEILNSVNAALSRRRREEELFGLEVDLPGEFIGALNVIDTILNQVEMDSYIIPGHSGRVSRHVLALGRIMDFSYDVLLELVVAARFHDIGKIFLSSDLRRKSVMTFTVRERAKYENHPIAGEKLIKDLKLFRKAPEIVRHHHETWDGKGFPDRLKGEKISLESSIIAVVEVYEAIRFARHDTQGNAQTETLAISFLRENAGSMFDPDMVRLFTSYLQSEVK